MKIQLKRSNVLDGGIAKEPTSSQMEYGELAVNYNNNDPALFLKDSNDNVIRIAGVGSIGTEDNYVNITGDNMTGDLTLGTDTIILNANNGNITAGKYNNLDVYRGNNNLGSNVAVGGSGVLGSNTTGASNAVFGQNAMSLNTEGGKNTAVGNNALNNNAIGNNNTAIGQLALGVSLADNNTGIGMSALKTVTTGANNTAVGKDAGWSVVSGERNTFIGYRAGYNTVGSSNTFLGGYQGSSADPTLNHTIILSAGAAEKLRIDETGSLLFGGTLPAAPAIELKADGLVRQWYASAYQTSGYAYYLGPNSKNAGGLYVQNNAGYLYLRDGDTDLQKIQLNGVDGSAGFAGDVKIGGTLGVSPNTQLNADGSAVFAGNVTLPGGGGDTDALQKQEIESLIAGSATVYDLETVTTEGNTTSKGILIGGTPAAPNISLLNNGRIIAKTFNEIHINKGANNITSNLAIGNSTTLVDPALSGTLNVGIGNNALSSVTTGQANVAIGSGTLSLNTTGINNIAFAFNALANNVDGSSNFAGGRGALRANVDGSFNIAFGTDTLSANVNGSRNLALGVQAGQFIEGSNNTILGSYTGSTNQTLNDTIILAAGQAEKLRIDDTGSLLFGGTLPSAPNIKLTDAGKITAAAYDLEALPALP